MRNTITLNGIASTTIAGLLIQELPAISKPLMRTTIEEIDGRDGDIVTELGYSAYDKEITIGLYGAFDINAVIAYFATEGTVVFSNEPDKFYRYKIIDKIDYERLVRYRTATVKLHCQPFKYPTSETPVQLGSGQTVTAEGTDLTMQGTALAPFVSITPKGDTSQQTYTGKNLFNKNDLHIYKGYISNAGVLSQVDPNLTSGNDRFIYMECEPNTTYTITKPLQHTTGNNRFALGTQSTLNISSGQHLADSWSGGDGTTTTTHTFTTSSDAHYLIIFIGKATDKTNPGGEIQDILDGLQVEKGSTATEYEPYVGGTAAPNPDYPQDVKVVTGEQTVTVTGKNINVYPYTGGGNGRGITFTANSDGTVTLNGQNNGQGNSVYFFLNNTTRILSAGTYYMIPPSNTKVTYVMYDGTNYYSFTPSNGYSRTFDTDTSIRQFYVQTYDTVPFSDFKVYPMLTTQASPTEADYEPYQSQEYELDLFENLYDKNSAYKSSYDIRLDINVQPNTTYIFNTGKAWTGAFLYDSNDTQTRKVGNDASGTHSVEFTTAANEVKARLTFYGGSSFDIETYDFSHIFFYVKNSIELCKIGDYQDYFYKSGNNWYKHEAIGKTMLGDLSYTNWQNTVLYYRDSDSGGIGIVKLGNPTLALVSNIFTTTNNESITFRIFYNSTNSHLNIYGDSTMLAMTEQEFKDWLANKNALMYYAKQNPTDTEITNATLIEQLNALGNANSYRDTTYIKTASDGENLPVILAVTATGKADGTVTNAGNTYAKPKLTIYGTGNIGIYLNGSQMFQIELGSEGHITIDTEKMEAYKDSESNLKNRLVTGDYSKFRLEAGANQINFSGNINKCVVENYTRWL